MIMYFKFFKNAFASNLEYKFDTIFRGIGQVIEIVVQISVWTALYYFNNKSTISNDNVELKTMIYYVIISAGISILVNNNVIYLIENKIRTGEISSDFIKPIDFQKYMFSIATADNIYNFIFRFIPILLIFIPFYGIHIPSVKMFILFFLSLINGILISFLLAYILGLVGFWYLSIWHLERILWDCTRLLSGSFIPLWFFPDSLLKITNALPFRFIYFVPISIFLEKIPFQESIICILQQLVWIVLLYIFSKWVWSKGIDKLVIQGG